MNRIILNSAEGIFQVSRVLADLDYTKPWQMTWKPYISRRSADQNSLFHVWMREVADQHSAATGQFYPPAVWKEYFKRLFLGEETIEIEGKKFDMVKHTSRLNVADMRNLMEQVQHYCGAELGIVLESINGEEI